jgi:hypothetical protein
MALAPIGRLLHAYRSPIGAFSQSSGDLFLLKPELVEASQQSYRMCVRRRSESSIGRHCSRPRSTLPNLIGAFFVPDDRPLVSGPQQFWNILSKLFSALDARCIKRCLSEGTRAERGPDFQMAGGNGNRGPCSRRRSESSRLGIPDSRGTRIADTWTAALARRLSALFHVVSADTMPDDRLS